MKTLQTWLTQVGINTTEDELRQPLKCCLSEVQFLSTQQIRS
jgi:hypothetical protein